MDRAIEAFSRHWVSLALRYPYNMKQAKIKVLLRKPILITVCTIDKY